MRSYKTSIRNIWVCNGVPPNSTLAQLSLVKEIAQRKGRDVEILGDPPKPRWDRCISSRFGFEIGPSFLETLLSLETGLISVRTTSDSDAHFFPSIVDSVPTEVSRVE